MLILFSNFFSWYINPDNSGKYREDTTKQLYTISGALQMSIVQLMQMPLAEFYKFVDLKIDELKKKNEMLENAQLDSGMQK